MARGEDKWGNKGRFQPTNPKKYKGDHQNIIYRSLWEKRLMKLLDSNQSVVEWSSEEIIIPYLSPLDNKPHRYFPDFYMKTKDSNGTIRETLIEVKPYAQTIEPKQKRNTKRLMEEVATYSVNQSKWRAAEEYCARRGWTFKIMTEYDLGLA